MDHVAAFGIGSTNFRYVGATPDGEFRTEVTIEPTRPHELGQQVLDAVDDLTARTGGSVDAVAASTTGLVDDTGGTIRKLDTPDGEVVDRVDLGSLLDRERSLPVFLQNDCNAAALGEWYFGSGGAQDCLAHLTIGTGIGGGVVERGRLVRGEAGQAGEFGLLPIAPDSGLESCGVTGAWEAVCSGRGIPRYVRHRMDAENPATTLPLSDAFTAEDVFDAAAAGDAFAQDCLDRIARYNAAGVGAVCNAVNPGLVTVGGGVALNNREWLLDGLETHLAEFCFVDEPEIRPASLGDDVGIYGALATYRAQASGVDAAAEARRASDATD